VIVSNRRVDLIEEGADVATRVRGRLDTDAELQVKIIGRASSKLVASRAFLDVHGRPSKPAELAFLPPCTERARRFCKWLRSGQK
jgi:DNA-binding transcriptional LysR family regulator